MQRPRRMVQRGGPPTALQSVLNSIARTAAKLCDARDARISLLDGDEFRLVAYTGRAPLVMRDSHPVDRRMPQGDAVLRARVLHIRDMQRAVRDRYTAFAPVARASGMRTVLVSPLMRGRAVLGVILIRRDRVQPFTPKQIALLKTFADQAAIAVENARLSEQLGTRNRELTAALAQQTATSDILKAISRAQLDVNPVFQAIADSAVGLCGAFACRVFRSDGDQLVVVGEAYGTAEARAAFGGTQPEPLGGDSPSATALRERRVVQYADVPNDPNVPERYRERARRRGYRALMAVPMIKDGTALGSIAVARQEPIVFSRHQQALLETFADQAVIAIENVRLFNELQARNRDLTTALDQQTATADILRTISRSYTDVRPVFQAIVDSARRLLRGNSAVLSRIIDDRIELAAYTHTDDAADVLLESFFPVPLQPSESDPRPIRDRVIGQGIPYNVADVETDPRVGDRGRARARARGYRSQLVLPMLRNGEPIGTLAVTRREPGAFVDEEVTLLQTFADQAVIAIENVRLFTELQERNRALTEALDQQTATSEILRVISRSPTDIQPVFSAIIGNAVRLCGAVYGIVWRYDDAMIHVGAVHNLPAAEEMDLRQRYPRALSDGDDVHRIMRLGRVIDVPDIDNAADLPPVLRANWRRRNVRSGVIIPMLRNDDVVGAIGVSHRDVGAFSAGRIELLQTFADQAVIAIENVRMFKELDARNRELTEALDQQTATAEMLRVISRSPTDIQPVLEAVAESVVRLCDSPDVSIFRIDGRVLQLAVHRGPLESIPPYGEERISLHHGTVVGRSVIERRTIHVPDLSNETEEYPEGSARARRFGNRTVLCVPLVRDDVAIGAVAVRRTEARLFTERQVALLQTFADQAVIAIENVRLFTELQARNRELHSALERETATSEILRVISRSPTDVQPTFEAIAASATALCNALDAAVFRFDGALIHFVANHNISADRLAAIRRTFPLPPSRGSVTARAILTRSIVHVPDLAADTEYAHPEMARMFRASLSVPMLRDGLPIGAITVARADSIPFTDTQIALLQTFADQAVIAVENVRLFAELQQRNHELSEALEQQTATSEILKVISSSPTDTQPVFETILANASRLSGASLAALWRFDGERMIGAAHYNASPQFAESIMRQPLTPSRQGPARQAALERRVVHVADITIEPGYSPVLLQFERARTVLAVPLLREETLVGVMTMWRREVLPFTEQQITLVQTFAAQAVIAIENVRLFTELQERNRALTEALDQQTATAEVLRVISSSPTEIQPVLDAVVESAARLCGARDALIYRVDGDRLRVAAKYGTTEFPQGFAMPVDRGSVNGRVVIERRTLHIHDLAAAGDEFPVGAIVQRQFGQRTVLAAPLLREGVAIGTMSILRLEVRPFTDAQIALLQTFAHQAVIAIENVRLFNELQERNRALTEALGQQTATAEILRVMSASPTDVQPVFDRIAERAVKLCEADVGIVTRFDGQLIHLAAASGVNEDATTLMRRIHPMSPDEETVTARTVRSRAVVHVGDVLADPVYRARDLAVAASYRSALGVPILREGQVIGVIFVARTNPGHFSDNQVDLLETFADQAVIAIENVRLFTELQQRNGALTEALEQQTATSEILRVISQSPTDVQPVFDTIIGNAVRLCGAVHGLIWRYYGDVADVVGAYNSLPEVLDEYRREFPRQFKPDDQWFHLTRSGAVVNIADLDADPDVTPVARARARAQGVRSLLIMPMRLGAEVIGTIGVTHREVGAFSPSRVELLKTFADQAVIAIENVRLFNELQARTNELTRSVQQLTALGAVGQAVSSTLDLETVLTTIASRASQLAGTDTCTVYEFDEAREEFHLRATHNVDDRLIELTRVRPMRKGEGVGGRVAETRAPVQVEDVANAAAYFGPVRDALLAAGVRSVLAIPLLREDRLSGMLIVSRKAPGHFADEVIALLQTFATQSAIAIQNARLYRELEAKGRELETASRHKSQFLANMSHELRTPMNAILGYTELIADGIYGGVPEPMREVLGRVDASGRHLLGLINDVLDLSKIEAGQLTLTLADYSMKEVVEAVVASVEALTAEKKLRLVVDLAPQLPVGRGDQRRLAQILLNLVGNAIKFTEQGQIAIRVGAASGLFTVAVSDTGPGIAAADQERIFEEFQQADTSTTRPKGGTGLGLAIARRIVAMHGGRIWVESVVGEGATFRFTMPIRVEEVSVIGGGAA